MADPATYRPQPGEIPTNPGVYRFRDVQDVVIYVGKAKNLRQRLNSYFADLSSLHPRTQNMVTTAARVEWTVVQNELESLQLEYTWIKKYNPRFNVRFRDDKSYPWLCVTWKDEFPRVFIGRGATKKYNRYFGPYPEAWAVRDSVDLLLKVFPMRSCSAGVFRNAQRTGRPCLLGYIDKCCAPCVGRVDAVQHRQIVTDFCRFMEGKSSGYIKELETQMSVAAQALDFESAAKFRDQVQALQKVTERTAIVLGDGTDADVIALADDPLEVGVQIFHIRSGRVQGQRGWVADRADDSSLPDLLESFLTQLYDEVDPKAIPKEILVSVLPSAPTALADLLTQKRGAKVNIHIPQRGEKAVLLDTVIQNAQQALARHKLKRSSDLATRNQALAEIQAALGLEQAPLRIEGFDISHTQGQEVVGSMVVFEDGMPRKSEYRKFIIKSFQGSNDTAAMQEVLTRRFKRLAQDRQALSSGQAQEAGLIDPVTGKALKFVYAPSLIVVDGGLPQVNFAAQVLSDMGVTDVALCGLAKRLEEVWLPGEEFPIILPRTSEGLYLLQRLRDESHRFAITHHRSRRSKAMLESVLDDIPGLGKARRIALLKYFGSLKKLRQATAEQIAQVPGVGAKLAATIHSHLQQQKPSETVNMTTGEITEG